jgi:glutathione S-transferase
LLVGEDVIGDSLAIAEWAAERAPELWPREVRRRALARSVTCEMHSSFGALRHASLCSIRRRAKPRELSAAVLRDIERVQAIWSTLCADSGGPYLFGESATIADAVFTPVATRFRTYGVSLSAAAQRYAEVLSGIPDFSAGKRSRSRSRSRCPRRMRIRLLGTRLRWQLTFGVTPV